MHTYINTFLCLISHDLPEEISLAKSMPSVILQFQHHLLYINVLVKKNLMSNICVILFYLFFIFLSVQAVKQNPSSNNSDKATPSRSGPVKKENIGAQYRHHPLRARRRPPKGMHLEQGDITSLSASHDAGVLTVRQLDTQLVSLKRQVCTFLFKW